jgi:hypothetical protein
MFWPEWASATELLRRLPYECEAQLSSPYIPGFWHTKFAPMGSTDVVIHLCAAQVDSRTQLKCYQCVNGLPSMAFSIRRIIRHDVYVIYLCVTRAPGPEVLRIAATIRPPAHRHISDPISPLTVQLSTFVQDVPSLLGPPNQEILGRYHSTAQLLFRKTLGA